VPPALFLLEGLNDAEFLLCIARILHRAQVIPTDLESLLSAQRLIIVPVGGGELGRVGEPI